MTERYGLLLTRDLMFTSKITSTAASLGLRIEVVATAEQLRLRSVETPPVAVFLDLNLPDLDPSRIVADLSNEDRPRVIAFGSHVDETRLSQARTAGCDDVLARSRLSASLPELLRQIFGLSE